MVKFFGTVKKRLSIYKMVLSIDLTVFRYKKLLLLFFAFNLLSSFRLSCCTFVRLLWKFSCYWMSQLEVVTIMWSHWYTELISRMDHHDLYTRLHLHLNFILFAVVVVVVVLLQHTDTNQYFCDVFFFWLSLSIYLLRV